MFTPPTYTYIAMMTLLVVWGLIRYATGSLEQLPVDHTALEQNHANAPAPGGEPVLL